MTDSAVNTLPAISAQQWHNWLIATPPASDVLDDGRNLIFRCRWHGRDVVIKRFRYLSRWQRWRYHRRGYGKLLLQVQLPNNCELPASILPLFWAGTKLAMLACFVVSGLMHTACMAPPRVGKPSANMATMHRAGLRHNDATPGNFLVDADGRCWVVDINRVQRQWCGIWPWSAARNLAQLGRSGSIWLAEVRQVNHACAGIRKGPTRLVVT